MRRSVWHANGQANRAARHRWLRALGNTVCAGLPAAYWRKLRGYLQDRRALAFPDRLQRRLTEAEPRPELREALVELWRLERGPAGRSGAGAAARAAVQVAACAKRTWDWEAAYARVGAVLGGVVRASSAVECVNSVLRMHQNRQTECPPRHVNAEGYPTPKLGMDALKLRDWVIRGWLHGRQTPAQGLWVVWADGAELRRLRKLKAHSKRGERGYPAAWTTPKERPQKKD